MKNSIFDLDGMNITNENIAHICTEKLQEKYHKKFKVCTIGERYGTQDNTTCKLVVQEFKNPLILFNVILDINFEIIFDDYYLKKVTFKLEDKIRNCFSSEIFIKLEIIGKNTLDENYELKKFLKTYNVRFIGFVISDKITQEDFEKQLNKLISEYKNIKLNIFFVNVNNIEYLKIKEKMKFYPEINKNLLEDYKILNAKKYSFEN